MYTESLVSLKANNGRNKSGICAAWAVPKDGLSALFAVPDVIKTAEPYPLTTSSPWITMKLGYSWLWLLKHGAVNMELFEEEKILPQGKIYEYTLAFPINNDDYTDRGKVLQAYGNREWIIIVQEKSKGGNRLLGSFDRGCDFKAQLSTGTTQKPANNYTSGFVWQSPDERAFYVSDTFVANLQTLE
jgi:hypothetical protein